MTLEFVGDAISLSGLTGTKLKCDMIGLYYSFWWKITSGGPRVNHQYPTAIVELNAATGEDYIKETGETVLGSAGHALELKIREATETKFLKAVLVEDHPRCYSHLKNVIRRRWPSVSIDEAEGPISSNSSNIYLLNKTLNETLQEIHNIELGNALYFFDPLRSVEYSTIESVARSRMRSFFQTGTEFIIFVFTSDWFLGREEFSPLPCTTRESAWTEEEKVSVSDADDLFGNTAWRNYILTDAPTHEKEKTLIELYRRRLHRWFRYVLPMPFNPKQQQIFHLILCSNYEAGVRATRDFYCSKTHNTRYSPDNSQALSKFMQLHPELWTRITGRERPLEWKMLWKIIRDHEEGICDVYCRDLREMERRGWIRQAALDLLEKQGYIHRFDIESPWTPSYNRYILDWHTIDERLGIDPPTPLSPLSPEAV